MAEKDIKKTEEVAEEVRELTDEELEQVTGGAAFGDVPRVKEHEYTEEVKERV